MLIQSTVFRFFFILRHGLITVESNKSEVITQMWWHNKKHNHTAFGIIKNTSLTWWWWLSYSWRDGRGLEGISQNFYWVCYCVRDDIACIRRSNQRDLILRTRRGMIQKQLISVISIYKHITIIPTPRNWQWGRLRTKLYDKRNDFNFPIENFPFICNNIPAAPAYGVYISHCIR
jgi:hypothetical protein